MSLNRFLTRIGILIVSMMLAFSAVAGAQGGAKTDTTKAKVTKTEKVKTEKAKGKHAKSKTEKKQAEKSEAAKPAK
jgi:hypothetical protein